MSESRRVQRVQKEINHLISQYLRSDWKGPCPGLLSVASVDVTPDLRSACVYISVLPLDGAQMDEFEELVADQRPEMQHHLSQRLNMKFVPRLKIKLGSYGNFQLDNSKAEQE